MPILFNVTGGSDLGLFEVNEAAEVIKEAADPEANIIFGTVIDDRMRDEVKVTVIATGFDAARSRPKPAVRPAAAEGRPAGSSPRSTKSRELLAEIERERIERTAFTVTPASEPFETEPGAGRNPDRRARAGHGLADVARATGLRRRHRPRHPELPAPAEFASRTDVRSPGDR